MVTIDIEEDEYSTTKHLRVAEGFVQDALTRRPWSIPGLVSVEWWGHEEVLAEAGQT